MTITGYEPPRYAHAQTHDWAMRVANRLAKHYGERFWVTRDGEKGWYVCPVSEKRKWLTDTASD